MATRDRRAWDILTLDDVVDLSRRECVNRACALAREAMPPSDGTFSSPAVMKVVQQHRTTLEYLPNLSDNVWSIWLKYLLCLRTRAGFRSSRPGMKDDDAEYFFWWNIQEF